MNPSRYSLLALSVLVLAVSGCNPLNSILNKFDQAIKEVDTLRQSLVSESASWRDQINKSQMQLTHDVKDIINVDLRDNIDKSIAETGIEARCEIDFVNQNLVAYLDGVRIALANKRAEIQKEGVLKGFSTPDEAIADIIKSVGHLDPYLCHTIPGQLKVTYQGNAPQQRKADRATVEFVGYALKRPAADKKPLSLYVFGPKRGAHGAELTNAGDFVATSNSYKVTLDTGRLLTRLDLTDSKVGLMWGGDSLGEVLIDYVKEEPPAVPKITDIVLHVGTTWDDKDKEIFFDYQVIRKSDNKVVGTIQKGQGEVWNDPSGQKPSWRSFTIPINPGDQFAVADRFGYRLSAIYHATSGDKNWNGRFSADAVVQGGTTLPVLGETPDDDMPKKTRVRSCDFDK